jgi:hypothetical protein
MCCVQSYFHQMDSFYLYLKQTLYFYFLIQMVYIEDQKISTEFHLQGVESPHYFHTLLRMSAYQFCIPRVGKHIFQTIDHWKVPHHQGRNISLLVVLLVRIIFIINTLRTDSSILLILFFHSVNIHMIVTSLVSTHTTYRTLCFELMLFKIQNTMIETCVYFIHT